MSDDERYVLKSECELHRKHQKLRFDTFEVKFADLKELITTTKLEQKVDIQKIDSDLSNFKDDFMEFRDVQYKFILALLILIVTSLLGIVIGRTVDFGWML